MIKSQSLLHTSLFLYAIRYFVDISSIENFKASIISDVLLLVAIGLCVLYLLICFMAGIANQKRVILKTVVLSVGLIIGMFVIFSEITYSIYPMFFLYLIASLYSNKEEFLICINRSILTILTILVVLSISGIIPNIQSSSGEYSLGLRAQVLPWYLFNSCAISMYVYRNHLKKIHYIMYAIINVLLYYSMKTRLALILIFFFMLLVYVYEKKGLVINEKLFKLTKVLFILLFFLTLFLTINYMQFPIINALLSGRPMFAMRVLGSMGVSWLPRNIKYFSQVVEGGVYTVYVDSGYIDLLVRFGILITVGIIVVYTYALSKAINNKNYMWAFWLISVAIFNVVNNSFMNIFLDSSLILIWNDIGTDDKKLFKGKKI